MNKLEILSAAFRTDDHSEAWHRFWGNVGGGPPELCWPWLGRTRYGYGIVTAPGAHPRRFMAHRVAWTVANGEIPPGLMVLHRCDNPPCVNPAHLFVGTQSDNMHDASVKGRTAQRERHGRHKLSEAEVILIRAEPASTPQKALALRFGITQGMVSMIRAGKNWRKP